jgi:hypothetical protein
MTELFTYTIKNFPREVQVSKAQRAKYYEHDKPLPKKYQTSQYSYKQLNKKLVLFDTITNTPIIKNASKAGQPKFHKISGNDLWAANLPSTFIQKLKATISEAFWQEIKNNNNVEQIRNLLKGKKLKIDFTFSTYKEIQDLDNLDIFYRKCIIDAITDKYEYEKGERKKLLETRILEDDSVKYIKEIHTKHDDCVQYEDSLTISIFASNRTVLDYLKTEILKINI